MAGPIRISILANANQAVSAFNRAGAEARSMGSRVSAVSGVLKGALVGAGIYKGVELLTSKFAEANETVQLQQQIAAQTAAALKSTGGAANVSAAQISAMADALEDKSLIDAEAIQSGQNLLLTFTNIRNAAGKGNDIFSQTTQIMTDMATAMGSDPRASAVQLGKALNDPVKGVTALSKVGVSFTQQQKDQIATLVESGNVMGAQKVVLAELSKEFGGSAAASAETAAGSFFRFKDAVDTVFEGIVRQALPVLADVADYLTANVPKAIAAAQPALDGLSRAFDSVRIAVEPVTDFLRDNPVLLQGAAAALGIAAVAAGALALGMGAVAVASSPITLTVLAIAALGAAVAYAYKNSETFRNAVAQVGQVITGTVVPALRTMGAYFTGTIVPIMVRTGQAVATQLKPILTQLAATFQNQIRPALAQVAAKFQEWWPTIKRVATAAAELYGKMLIVQATIVGKVIPVVIRLAGQIIATVVPAILRFVSGAASAVAAAIDFGRKVIDAGQKVASFARTVSSKIGEVVGFFTGLPGRITGAIGDLGSLLYDKGVALIQGLLNGVNSMIDKVTGAISDLGGKIKGAAGGLSSLFSRTGTEDIFAPLYAGFSQGSSGIQATLDGINKIIEKHFAQQLKSTKKQIEKQYDDLAKGLKKRLDGKALKAALARNEKARDHAQGRADSKATKAQKALNKLTADLRGQIVANGVAQDAANQSYTDANNTLTSMRDNAQQYADSIRDAVTATGSLSTLGQGNGFSSIDQLLQQRTAAVAKAQQFTTAINALTSAGLNTNDLQDVISQGVDNGLTMARALLAGGPGVIGQMNTLSAQLVASGTQLGGNVAQTLYGAGIQAQQGLVDGLKANLDAVIAQGDALGRALVKAVKKALKIHSPSRVFEEVGGYSVKGLAIGLDETYVRRQGTQLAGALTRGFGTPALDAYMSSSAVTGGGNKAVTVTFTAEQIDQLTRGRAIQADIDAWASVGGRSKAS